MKRRILLIALIVLAASAAGYYALISRATTLALTGIVTTNDVVVSSQVGGQLSRVAVKEGDVVKRDQIVAVVAQDELRAERAYYASAAEGATSQVQQSAAALRLEEQ